MSSDRRVGFRAARSPVVIAGAIAVLAAATILGALGFELAGYVPCELCLKERIPYYAGVPLAAVVAVLASRRRRGLLPAGFAALALIFAAGTGLSIYHAGVEWGFWPGPASCSGTFRAPVEVGDFLHQLKTANVVRCDAPALRILGLSLAGWDAVVSAVLALLAAWGASRGHEAAPTGRPDYGYDAPGIMLGLALGGGAAVLAGGIVAGLAPGWWHYGAVLVAIAGLVPLFLGLLMIVYAVVGKARTREHILDLTQLTGSDSVLDIGTGAGLLLVGAAKRATRGKVVGIDLWASKDLSNNAAAVTARNAALEGVGDRVEILTGDARALPFPPASFDRAVSLLCLHNIEDKADQARACREIARVLKPGGRVVIGDYVPTHGYAAALAACGLTVVRSSAAFGVALSLMWIVVADKPAR